MLDLLPQEITGLLDLARPYSRRILEISDEYEIMMAHWNAGMECAPHDHGASGGYVLFLSGQFVEKQYEMVDGVLRQCAQHPRKAGEIVTVVPGEIHSCFSENGGVSLHIYTPPIEGMRVFDIVNNEILTVHASAGAWLPQPEELILSRE